MEIEIKLLELEKKLTKQQLCFIGHFGELGNAKEACIRSGYSEKGARMAAHRNLKNPRIIEYLKALEDSIPLRRIARRTHTYNKFIALIEVDRGAIFDEAGSVVPYKKLPWIVKEALILWKYDEEKQTLDFRFQDIIKNMEALSKFEGWNAQQDLTLNINRTPPHISESVAALRAKLRSSTDD